MNFKSMIEIFRGDDSDALGYQTIVGTIHTDLDLSGCKAVFRYLGFFQEFEPIPEDGKITIVIPSASSKTFPPGLGYASLRIYDMDRKVRTFTNRIPVLVSTMTPSCGCGKFDIRFSPFPELEPLKIFIGPNADDFDQYTGFISKIIDRASLEKYGLAMLVDEMGEDGGNSGRAASPAAVKAAYDAIIKELTDNYYTAAETDEAINSVAAYYITRNAAGDAFATKAQLDSTTVFYSGGNVRVPTRNDYCVVLADETHDGAEYRYIYAVAEGQTTGSWEAQFPVGGVMTIDQAVTRNSANPVTSSGIWSAIWGMASTAFSSLYDWCVSQLAGKLDKSGGTVTGDIIMTSGILDAGDVQTHSYFDFNKPGETPKYLDSPVNSGKALTDADIQDSSSSLGAALNGKLDKSGGEMTGVIYGIRASSDNNRTIDLARIGLAPAGTNRKGAGKLGVCISLQDNKEASLYIDDDGKVYINTPNGYVEVPNATNGGTLALTAGTGHNGNLAALDANGNPTDSGVKPSDKLDSTSAAPAFSSDSSVQYPVDSRVTYNGKLYKCIAATTGGTWVAGSWTADTMTDPDAVLDITSQNQLRVVAKDGTLLWAQGYDLASTSSATLACDATNNFTFADGATTQAFALPTAPTGKVGDFGLDIDNSANTSAATMTLTGLDTAFSVVVPKGESLNDMLAIAAGELARFYITLSTFRVNNLPTWHIVKQVVENGGAQS